MVNVWPKNVFEKRSQLLARTSVPALNTSYSSDAFFLIFRSPNTKNCKREVVYHTEGIHDISGHKMQEKR